MKIDGGLVTPEAFLLERQPRLDANPERGRAVFFQMEDFANLCESRREAVEHLTIWCDQRGYRWSKNEVNYVCVIRDAIDRKPSKRAE